MTKLSERMRVDNAGVFTLTPDSWSNLADEVAALEQRVERLEQELAGEIARANRAIAAYNALASQEDA